MERYHRASQQIWPNNIILSRLVSVSHYMDRQSVRQPIPGFYSPSLTFVLMFLHSHAHTPRYLYMANSVVAVEHVPEHNPKLPFIINSFCADLYWRQTTLTQPVPPLFFIEDLTDLTVCIVFVSKHVLSAARETIRLKKNLKEIWKKLQSSISSLL